MGHWADQHVKPAIQYRERPAPKPRRRVWPVALLLLVVAGGGGAAWHYRDALMPTAPVAEQPVPEAAPVPVDVRAPTLRPTPDPVVAPVATPARNDPPPAAPVVDAPTMASPARPDPEPILRGIATMERQRAEHVRAAESLQARIEEAATKRYSYQGRQYTYLEMQRKIHKDATAAGDSSTAFKATQAASMFNDKLGEWATKAKFELGVVESIDKRIAVERAKINPIQ